jgi:hypothetical protein
MQRLELWAPNKEDCVLPTGVAAVNRPSLDEKGSPRRKKTFLLLSAGREGGGCEGGGCEGGGCEGGGCAGVMAEETLRLSPVIDNWDMKLDGNSGGLLESP